MSTDYGVADRTERNKKLTKFAVLAGILITLLQYEISASRYSRGNLHFEKLLLIFILLSVFAFVPIYHQDALGNECPPDKDWPAKPCPDSATSQDKEELTRLWDKYYEMKGKAWMDMKKAEMDKVIQNGTFGDWIDDPVNGPANKNVYTYYRLHDAVPNMVLDPYTGNYIVQGTEPPRGEWYTTTTGLTAIAAIGAVAAVASFFAYKKALRK